VPTCCACKTLSPARDDLAAQFVARVVLLTVASDVATASVVDLIVPC
jgi:hypothetical protein